MLATMMRLHLANMMNLPFPKTSRGGYARPLAAALLCLLPLGASAQYAIHEWTHFEDATLGKNFSLIGGNPETAMRVVDVNTVGGVPPEFRTGDAAREIGRYCLELDASPANGGPVGIAVGDLIDRDKLGPNARALFQADFFIPKDQEVPSLAVLAMAPPDDSAGVRPKSIKTPGKFYRFGLTQGSQGTTPYFSYVTPEKATAKTYRHDPQVFGLLPRPGWRRFAMMISGKNIFCYFDGRGTNFSPVEEVNLRQLLVGVALADSKRTYKCYVDNISIQVSEEAAPVPDSPYRGWTIPPGEAMLRSGSLVGSEGVRDLRWLDAEAAWGKAQKERKPMMLFFYVPGMPNCDRINDMFKNVPGAATMLDTHACARIDVNQLRGGTVAKQYGIYKIPALLTISPDAQKYKRYLPAKSDDWFAIEKQVKLE